MLACFNASGFFRSSIKTDEKPLGGNTQQKLHKMPRCWQAAVSAVLLDAARTVKDIARSIPGFCYFSLIVQNKLKQQQQQ